MKHIVEVDPNASPEGIYARTLASAETGIDSCVISYLRLPSGHRQAELHEHSVDHFYYIVDGALKVQLGTDVFEAASDTMVFIPAGTPHSHWNDSTKQVRLLEVRVPVPPAGDVTHPAEPRKIGNAATLLRRPKQEAAAEIMPSAGFHFRSVADRKSGSENVSIAVVELEPAAGGARTHFHDFDQFYFVLEGTLNVQIGSRKMSAGANSLVVLPAGILHANFNSGPGIEKHVTLRVPEPSVGEPPERLVNILDESQM